MNAGARLAAAALMLTTSALIGRPAASSQREVADFDPKKTPFAITSHGETFPYREMSTFVMPGATLTFEAVGGPAAQYVVTARDRGAVTTLGPRQWRWTAPAAWGVYDLTFGYERETEADDDAITLHVFVMVPAGAVLGGYLNGYRIGTYPAKPLKGIPIYLPPPGFIEVTKENQDTPVSPHFKLKQFVCKQDTARPFPKYVVLKERLVLKLEAILERVNALGFDVDTLRVMSGYRTPYYNGVLGDALYSMHQFGGAADVFVDSADKGRMDDLNIDHVVDIADAKFLYDEIDRMLAPKAFVRFHGGMGFYPATRAHPPFVHVDVRGAKARWHG